ncbi:hypothetical protein JK359_17250 [Streptomyces actinomycinicus]|uniref:ABM domain-containing protein n=1 Tax=Streptomyces actinomycinicus TaxID=1695166 RepID=A0A937EJN1_9ACTN|nr:hypothetical protein [Streptomyces actinomycinicus]MBL1083693.1 hypothetical protein [Streptomyces actinomycinicus]
MAIIVIFDIPGGGQELYDACIDRLTGGGGFTSLADIPAPGLISHAAGPVGGGWRVVDVWESEEALENFSKILQPVLSELGHSDGEPQIIPAYNVVAR